MVWAHTNISTVNILPEQVQKVSILPATVEITITNAPTSTLHQDQVVRHAANSHSTVKHSRIMPKTSRPLVGRPQCRKEHLFNRLAGERLRLWMIFQATRDRLVVEAEWAGRVFNIVDTVELILPRQLRSQSAASLHWLS